MQATISVDMKLLLNTDIIVFIPMLSYIHNPDMDS